MCLTWSGSIEPEEELCGKHGTCIDRTCICSPDWSTSFDINQGYFGQNDYSILFREFKNDSESIVLKDFIENLLLSSPCTRYDPIMAAIFSFSVISCSFSLAVSFYNKEIQKIKQVHILRTISLVSCLIYSIMKQVKGNRAHELFNFPVGFLFGIFVTSLNATVIFYLYKHLQYQTQKARMLYTLQISLFGYEISM
eukprot:snap_masked-scaffold_3-processed-gene-21.62-mRNA-1 protein AED:1.00 eAED:1.00 QI:0/0/0/0/1/1/2/0/195